MVEGSGLENWFSGIAGENSPPGAGKMILIRKRRHFEFESNPRDSRRRIVRTGRVSVLLIYDIFMLMEFMSVCVCVCECQTRRD